ncbi:MAG TPA: ribonuclease P protein component [Chitinophagaceae bacterium]|nr:ribonuclease P protein component [Chitinophagaceae bacterium]
MAKQFTLGKQERLKSRKLLEQVFREGKVFSQFPFKVFYIPVSHKQRLMFGVGVSRKHFKKATDRNRIKRLVREAYRVQKKELLHTLEMKNRQLAVFFIYTGKDLPDFGLAAEKTSVVLKRLCAIIHENDSSTT